MTALLGSLLVAAASLLAYLASPNRKIARAIARPRRFGGAAALAAVAGLALLLCTYGPATAVFIAATLAMLLLSLVPLAIAWLQGMPEEGR